MSYWKRIKSLPCISIGDDFHKRGLKSVFCISGWETDDEQEDGKLLAKILVCECNNIIVEYKSYQANFDEDAQAVINGTIKSLEKEFPKEESSPNKETIEKLKSLSEDLNVMITIDTGDSEEDVRKGMELTITEIINLLEKLK